jgi:hypothetical protein
MLTAVLKAVKMLLSCCPKSSQDAEKNHSVHKDQVQRLILIILPLSFVCRLVGELDHPDPRAKLKNLILPRGLVSRSVSWSLMLM